MRNHATTRQKVFLAAGCLFFASCGEIIDGDGDPVNSGKEDAAPVEELKWFSTCGDPVCGGYVPTPGVPVCTDESVGDACGPRDARCEIENSGCNVDLLCTDSDPATMCPISQRSKKRDIHYVTPAERARLAGELLDTRLATYRYRSEAPAAPARLGFIIDDQPDSPAVQPSGERVDLYAYTSMAVAAIQAQAETIEKLEREVVRLRSELESMKKAQKAHTRR